MKDCTAENHGMDILTFEAGEGVVIDQEKTQKYLVIRDAPCLHLTSAFHQNSRFIFPITSGFSHLFFEQPRLPGDW